MSIELLDLGNFTDTFLSPKKLSDLGSFTDTFLTGLTKTIKTTNHREGFKKKKKNYWKIPIRRWPPPPPYWKILKKRKMIYAPWNEFCMIWVIFLMPTDQVMAFLCFIFDNQSVDMSGQVWGGGRGGHNWKKQVCLKMVFRQFQVFLALFFFLLENRPSLIPPPSYWNFPIIFFFFFFETFPNLKNSFPGLARF